MLYEELRKRPDTVAEYLCDFSNSSFVTKNEFGIISQASRFQTIIFDLRNSRILFPQHFQQFEQEAKIYVENREEVCFFFFKIIENNFRNNQKNY